MELQFGGVRFKRIDRPQDIHPQIKEGLLIFIFRIPGHFNFHKLFLELLFGVENAVELGTLVTDTVFIDQGTPVVEDADHFAAGGMQVIFHHRFGSVYDCCNLFHLEFANLFEQQDQLLFERQRFGDTRKTEGDMLPDLKLALRRGHPDLHHLTEKFAVIESGFPTDIRHLFGPALPVAQQVPGQIGSDGKDPGFEGGFASIPGQSGMRFQIGILYQVLGIFGTCGHAQQKSAQLRAVIFESGVETFCIHRLEN